jgi:hypothetical protein
LGHAFAAKRTRKLAREATRARGTEPTYFLFGAHKRSDRVAARSALVPSESVRRRVLRPAAGPGAERSSRQKTCGGGSRAASPSRRPGRLREPSIPVSWLLYVAEVPSALSKASGEGSVILLKSSRVAGESAMIQRRAGRFRAPCGARENWMSRRLLVLVGVVAVLTWAAPAVAAVGGR